MRRMGEIFARRYELIEPIAEGGMGAVWQVRDHLDGTVKAAKLLRQSDAGSLLRFIREQATRIDHAHVVTPLSWVGEDDAVLFTMPLVRGGSVATLVGDWGPLPEQWVVTVLDQTLAALEAVHAAGVVHRDVKPANLLLEPTGSARPHVRLSDFGIATTIGQPRLTTGAVALGTPGYAAPEQRAGADPDPTQDVFSAATVGLEMLIGHLPPFSTDELPTTALGGLLLDAANPDPARRPQSAAAFRSALAQHLETDWRPGGIEVLDHFLATDRGMAVDDPVRPTSPLVERRPVPDLVPTVDRPGLGPVLVLALLGVVLLLVSILLLLRS